MSGKFNGVQSKETRIVFNTIESLYKHFSHPTKNKTLVTMQRKLEVKISKINSLSDTRWNCRWKNCESVINNYEASRYTFNNAKESFVIFLFILHYVLSSINILGNKFQDKSATLGETGNQINSVILSFENARSTIGFSDLCLNIKTFCDKNEVKLILPFQTQVSKRIRHKPNVFEDNLLTTATSAESFNSTETNSTSVEKYYRFKILDCIIVNLKKRFSTESLQMAEAVNNFIKLDFKKNELFINHYKCSIRNACCEDLSTSKSSINFEALISVLSKNIYLNMHKRMQVAVSLPISSTTCEHSAMRRIKTWLRSSMLQNRFNNLAIISIENNISKKIDNEYYIYLQKKKIDTLFKINIFSFIIKKSGFDMQ
ncbi:hypothetical protein AGLY_017173 [Aphis glycines]|uniref:HAT C-terminal dimerisation domain-containing protein n=1 Tax=Aphis glycines TaxID=307491 RepID=A0A6G0SWT2_APHGL|nr:hypothetical protein AGLY_017173 [Aphis glycines]